MWREASSEGFLKASNAMAFFTQFGLERIKLGKIWVLADERKRNKLSEPQFYKACKLVVRTLCPTIFRPCFPIFTVLPGASMGKPHHAGIGNVAATDEAI